MCEREVPKLKTTWSLELLHLEHKSKKGSHYDPQENSQFGMRRKPTRDEEKRTRKCQYWRLSGTWSSCISSTKTRRDHAMTFKKTRSLECLVNVHEMKRKEHEKCQYWRLPRAWSSYISSTKARRGHTMAPMRAYSLGCDEMKRPRNKKIRNRINSQKNQQTHQRSVPRTNKTIAPQSKSTENDENSLSTRGQRSTPKVLPATGPQCLLHPRGKL